MDCRRGSGGPRGGAPAEDGGTPSTWRSPPAKRDIRTLGSDDDMNSVAAVLGRGRTAQLRRCRGTRREGGRYGEASPGWRRSYAEHHRGGPRGRATPAGTARSNLSPGDCRGASSRTPWPFPALRGQRHRPYGAGRAARLIAAPGKAAALVSTRARFGEEMWLLHPHGSAAVYELEEEIKDSGNPTRETRRPPRAEAVARRENEPSAPRSRSGAGDSGPSRGKEVSMNGPVSTPGVAISWASVRRH